MKKLLLASSVLLALTNLATAADTQQPIDTQSQFNWTGLYVGGQIGGGGESAGSSDNPAFVPLSMGGFIGGVYAGYNWQLPGNNIVLGVDTDFTFNGIDADGSNASGYAASLDWRWYGAVRGRIGYAFDRFMPYIAGGFAYGKIAGSYTWPDNYTASGDKTDTGWTLGGGLEYAFTDNLIGRLEYRYTDFGTVDISNAAGDHVYFDTAAHDVRVGLSYKF